MNGVDGALTTMLSALQTSMAAMQNLGTQLTQGHQTRHAGAAIDDMRATLERPNLPAHEKKYLTAKFQRAVVMESKARAQLEKAENDLQSIVDQRPAKVRQTLLQPTNEPIGLDTSWTSTIQASAGQLTMLRAISTGNGRSPPTLTKLRTMDPAVASTPAMPESPSPASPSPTGRQAPRTGLKRSSTETQLCRVRVGMANWVEAVIASESEARDSWAQYSLESVELGIA
ncbi:BQ5605_C006g04327 [Microbotryum silenes-dioicae]|uniref:BQ5605_C006g04327 protein n=1 Tax=Microbotryum silenes-dioicae TaxID=796604 RepID=A0A2X0P2E1_9BASI|nr:BQ5605_C006g04327 [Microbotryum silenes-dioicae]